MMSICKIANILFSSPFDPRRSKQFPSWLLSTVFPEMSFTLHRTALQLREWTPFVWRQGKGNWNFQNEVCVKCWGTNLCLLSTTMSRSRKGMRLEDTARTLLLVDKKDSKREQKIPQPQYDKPFQHWKLAVVFKGLLGCQMSCDSCVRFLE